MGFGQLALGWVCVALGIGLVLLHGVTVYQEQSRLGVGLDTGGPEGLQQVATSLAEKAPSLAGGLAFVLLGAMILGYLHIEFATSAG